MAFGGNHLLAARGAGDQTVPMVLTAVVALLLTVVAWAAAEWLWWRPKKLERILRQQGLSGNPYRLYYGDLKESSRMLQQAKSKPMNTFSNHILPRLRPFLYHYLNKYGRNCFYWEGPVPVVNIDEPELMRQVLNRYTDFQKPMTNPIAKLFFRGLISYEGDKWAAHRKLINPAFHLEKLKFMVPSFHLSCAETLNKWEKMLADYSQQEVDVWPYISSITADAISRAAFGSSFEEGRTIFALIKEQLALTSLISQSVYFPGLRFLPTRNNKKMWELDRKIGNLIACIIDKRKKEKESKNDLLGLLLASTTTDTIDNIAPQNPNQNNNHNREKVVLVNNDDLIHECKEFYFAGQETTANLLVWTMLLLSKHQDWQARAREEVLTIFRDNKEPTSEALSNLKLINMILLEVLRLYPPAVELRRIVARDNTKLGSLSLPSGVLVIMPIASVHQNREQWGEDASEFNPARFSDGISKASVSKNGAAAFMPFGWGPRICVGSNFALIQAKVVLSMILQRFSFELSPAYSHSPTSTGALLHPQLGVHLLLRRL